MNKKKLGHILTGSLTQGLLMRLESECELEELKTGKFVSIHGTQYTFFSLITDIELQVSNQDILLFPPTPQETILSDVLKKRDIYAKLLLKPLLMLDHKQNKMPVKTVPAHFTPVFEATAQDVAQIFGDEQEDTKFFNIGSPLDMDVPVCLDLTRFIERSNGIFGKTGTGKTFITRLLLAGLVHSGKAVNLIFDMHSEYGFQARKEGAGHAFVKGLKTLFPSNVAIFSLDPESTRKRGCAPDFEVNLSYRDIRVEDVMPLQDELNLHQTALEAAYLIASKYKEQWLEVLLAQEGNIKDFAASIGAHAESVGALYRKLKRLERFPFISETGTRSAVIDRMLEYLDRGIHVVLEFGKQTSMLCYLLVANIISRRIHEQWVTRTEQFLATQDKSLEPKHLVITIEEAHKFLNSTAAKQTIFGIIAREMRKYYVSLLVVDQRPSGIDEEIISQLGTKVVAQLNDEKDINSVLTGAASSGGLRSVLATLESKQQALVLGHAVPMPIVIKTREYNEQFYAAMSTQNNKKKNSRAIIDEIF
ncbi:MAG: ATP-binding protein [Epsilonproteobacteria bacterium]|nr:ATP-binding protein [Campylobacterota bacterium]